MALNIVIIEKTGVLKSLAIKEFKEEELFKKCGFKKAEDFVKQHEWSMKTEGRKFIIQVFAKSEGRPNSENKYDFPPPIDTKLFFGNCAIVAKMRNDDGSISFTNLSLEMWERMYEKLFGGFEDLTTNAAEDENEEDELENVPKHKKTKDGYLKDGFVVDSSDGDEDEEEEDEAEEEEEDDSESNVEEDGELVLEDLGSELTEESYDYESESENDDTNKK
uniref:Uncharacterized protein n=1 Tax=viral metagenome TaxID=1070528 RepID=A0A6C0IGD1_9ZZZZ